MRSNRTNEDIPSTAEKRRYTSSWIEGLNKYQRPSKVAKTRPHAMSLNEDSGRACAISLREGPMPNLINGKDNRSAIPIDSNRHSQGRKANSNSNNNRITPKHTIIDLSNDDNNDEVTESRRYSTSNTSASTGVTYYSASMNKDGDRLGTSFTPHKVEPFEMPPTYTSSNASSSHKKLVITVSDARQSQKNVPKKSKKKSRKDQVQDDPNDYEPITIEDDPPSNSFANVMMQRAIERSKFDMGILKRKEEALKNASKPSSNTNQKNKQSNNTLMPKRVQQLLISESDETDEDERNRQISEYAKLAMEHSKQMVGPKDSALVENPTVADAEGPQEVKESKSQARKRRRAERKLLQEQQEKEQEIQNQQQQQEQQQQDQQIDSPTPSDDVIIQEEFEGSSPSTSKKIPKLTDDPVVKSMEYLQCAFVDGLKGRCPKTGSSVYCAKHERVVRDIESAFNGDNGDLLNLDSNSTTSTAPKNDNNSKKKRPPPSKPHGLSTENRDILLGCLKKIKQLDIQEKSFQEKAQLIQDQIRVLNRLSHSFVKQQKGVCEEKQRFVDIMITLINSWAPLFVDVSDTSDLAGFESVVQNQKVVSKMLSCFHDSTPPEDNNSENTTNNNNSEPKTKGKK